MLTEIKNILKNHMAPSSQISPSSKAGTLFEVWICLRISDELNNRGITPFLYEEGAPPQQITANPNRRVQTIKFKSGPGKIGSGNGCFIIFDWGGVAHEIHTSIEFEGRSGSLHEIDVSIIPALIANDIRTNRFSGYPHGAPKIAIECKDKKSNGSKDEARTFLARLYDIHFLKDHREPIAHLGSKNRIYASTQGGQAYGNRNKTYYDSLSNSYNAMCHSGIVVQEAINYLDFYHVKSHQQLTPGLNYINAFITQVVDYICIKRPV